MDVSGNASVSIGIMIAIMPSFVISISSHLYFENLTNSFAEMFLSDVMIKSIKVVFLFFEDSFDKT